MVLLESSLHIVSGFSLYIFQILHVEHFLLHLFVTDIVSFIGEVVRFRPIVLRFADNIFLADFNSLLGLIKFNSLLYFSYYTPLV